jgi:hypothetical protein
MVVVRVKIVRIAEVVVRVKIVQAAEMAMIAVSLSVDETSRRTDPFFDQLP